VGDSGGIKRDWEGDLNPKRRISSIGGRCLDSGKAVAQEKCFI
jgi:hypothetical protein